jgi:hypothetical protein
MSHYFVEAEKGQIEEMAREGLLFLTVVALIATAPITVPAYFFGTSQGRRYLRGGKWVWELRKGEWVKVKLDEDDYNTDGKSGNLEKAKRLHEEEKLRRKTYGPF